MSWAASRMSAAVASSFHIDRLGRAQDVFPPDPVAMLFDLAALDQIDFAPETLREFIGHPVVRPWPVCQITPEPRTWCIKKIQIAIGAKIVSQHRAKDLQ